MYTLICSNFVGKNWEGETAASISSSSLLLLLLLIEQFNYVVIVLYLIAAFHTLSMSLSTLSLVPRYTDRFI